MNLKPFKGSIVIDNKPFTISGQISDNNEVVTLKEKLDRVILGKSAPKKFTLYNIVIR